MNKYKIIIDIEDKIIADNEEEAYENFWKKHLSGNEDINSFIDSNLKIVKQQ